MTTTSAAHAQAPTLRNREHQAQRRRVSWAFGTTLVWGTCLAAVYIWVRDAGIQALWSGLGPSLTSVGRITGLVASNLLLVQIFLMARVPVLERGFRRDAITRAHRTIGFWSFWLMLAHIVLVSVGYAVAAQVSPLTQLWKFVVDYPGMLLAAAGTLLLVMVVLTSVARARRKFRYESWHLLRLHAHLGAGLVLPHQLRTGATSCRPPSPRTTCGQCGGLQRAAF